MGIGWVKMLQKVTKSYSLENIRSRNEKFTIMGILTLNRKGHKPL